ncbi:hypothetical protein CDAR_281811 [Caerostris darwini]|uniref:Uncharacterized protein n=1 Tax=Caerostris darwini TaxID=1538125 RepID=A0AAV4WQA1_9ARAC|nr:hypothetical protein CDAR_281811 [Caerostris darwini]
MNEKAQCITRKKRVGEFNLIVAKLVQKIRCISLEPIRTRESQFHSVLQNNSSLLYSDSQRRFFILAERYAEDDRHHVIRHNNSRNAGVELRLCNPGIRLSITSVPSATAFSHSKDNAHGLLTLKADKKNKACCSAASLSLLSGSALFYLCCFPPPETTVEIVCVCFSRVSLEEEAGLRQPPHDRFFFPSPTSPFLFTSYRTYRRDQKDIHEEVENE